ncbi:MAG TPA: penicillin-binding protein 1C [Burkholderiales bacterium]|nr:penicillin-binding protein 1C [Burkholderiales bacterium]
MKKLLGTSAGFLFAAGFVASLFVEPYDVVPYSEVKSEWRSSDAWLLDRNGEPLSRIRIDKTSRRGDWTALRDVSPALIVAVLAAEDRRFLGHAGVDWLALPGALRDQRGGSTITMQLAAWLHPELARSGSRGLVHKWRQMRQAMAMERRWNKDELLEAWLNLTPFRGELEGIDAASRSLFAKRPDGLDRAESALLAALVRAPNAASARVTRRACALVRPDDAACREIQWLALTGLKAAGVSRRLEGDAPHLARRLLTTPGERRRSTLDARLQRFAAETLERHLRELDGRNVEDGAALVLDNASGDILAWVGSSGELSSAAQVDGVTAKRLPGSTLKPFLYALAIERRLLTAASLLDDTPTAITTPSGLYVPQNYDRSFRGKVSLRTALAGSLNVPAVRTLALVGYEPFHRRLREVGFSLERDADHYGYALGLGGAEVTLLELTRGYRRLARFEGFDERAAYIVGDILADAAARATTFGLANPLATRYAASVKTGTSTDMRDNWAVGYSARYTVGVWVGNFSGEPMHDVSGVSGAAPVWREIMDYLHEGAPAAPPAAPTGLIRKKISYANAAEPPRDEWFLAGTETALIVPLEAPARRPRIVSPANGAILAIDPDIPMAYQRVRIEVSGAGADTRLMLDDGSIAPQLWLPPPGRHVLRLVSASGAELDRVQVTVRGLR